MNVNGHRVILIVSRRFERTGEASRCLHCEKIIVAGVQAHLDKYFFWDQRDPAKRHYYLGWFDSSACEQAWARIRDIRTVYRAA